MALLIAEKAKTDTVEGDLEAICRLLGQKCAWSDESIVKLKRTVARALDASGRAYPPGTATE